MKNITTRNLIYCIIMKATEMLNKVKDLLSGEATKSEDIQENPQEEVKLEQQSLVNGTILEAESFESGIKKTLLWYINNSEWIEDIKNNKYNLDRLGTYK